MEQADCVVIGAGVIGLAVARELALAGREVIVLEAAGAIGTGTSSRNSEVIHAGLYYPPGSLKARACVEGKTRLYAYCAERGIEARLIGKLLVAAGEAQTGKLAAIKANAERCGVSDLRWLTAEEAHALERQVRCTAALFSPSSGILDSHAFMLALQGDMESAGGMIAFNSAMRSGRAGAGGIVVAADAMELEARLVINAAGLFAPALARAIEGVAAEAIPKAYFAKGNYFALSGARSPFRHLIYPMPEDAGLGIHATLDLGGGVRFGPDVEWVEAIDYTVDSSRAEAFYGAIRRYWPGLPGGALAPAYSGIRPKIAGPGEAAADFMIQGPQRHGVAGLWNLFGIESPGLTASLALAVELRYRIEA
ncbi:MAG: NAD(P)/FAD-dependent oxidoreductase [Rhodomicrobium sp.]